MTDTRCGLLPTVFLPFLVIWGLLMCVWRGRGNR